MASKTLPLALIVVDGQQRVQCTVVDDCLWLPLTVPEENGYTLQYAIDHATTHEKEHGKEHDSGK